MDHEGAMFGAVTRGDVSAVRALIAVNPSLLTKSKVGKNWIHWAAQRGHTQVISLLVDAGIDIDQLTDDGTSSALDIAAGQGHFQSSAWLIEHGADINRNLGSAATPMFSAIYGKSLDVVRLFVDRGATLDAGFGVPRIDVISYAEQYGTPEIVEFLRRMMRVD